MKIRHAEAMEFRFVKKECVRLYVEDLAQIQKKCGIQSFSIRRERKA